MERNGVGSQPIRLTKKARSDIQILLSENSPENNPSNPDLSSPAETYPKMYQQKNKQTNRQIPEVNRPPLIKIRPLVTDKCVAEVIPEMPQMKRWGRERKHIPS